MKTLLLEIDESIYTQVINSLRIFPEQQCHIIETPPPLKPHNEPLDITSAFGLIKTPLTATLADFEAEIISEAIDAALC